jgi:CheY-like chemotaxis protein
LLDFSQLTAGKLPLDAASFDLRSVLEQTLEAQRLRASNKGLALRCEMGAEFPQRLVGDDLRLRQIVTNLISNAIKFTANGEIVVRVARSAATIDGVPADANSAIMLHFAVSDTGSMLVASDGERILTPFTKTHAGPTQPFGAAGLGLAVASSLVQLMHGQTWVESDSGVGSTLHFTAQFALPLDSATCDCADRASPTGVVVRPLRVLLAEDAPANQRVVATILRERGHAVQIAPHGRAALEALHQRHFDAVLMDIHMPIMDGFAATRAIRALGDPRKAQVPIIAVTAYALEHDRQRCLGAGMDGYLTKPVDGPALINLVERLAAPTAEPDPPVRAVGAPALSPRRA